MIFDWDAGNLGHIARHRVIRFVTAYPMPVDQREVYRAEEE